MVGYNLENMAPMGSMRPLAKNITMVPLITTKKYRSQWKMYALRGLKTNLLHILAEKLCEEYLYDAF